MFLLLLMGLGAASVKAQVRIGGNAAPNASAILDLNATDATNNGTKGLALPRVDLTSSTMLLSGVTSNLTGMMVYNTTATLGAIGIYYWNGATWVRASLPSTSAADSGKVLMSTGQYAAWTPNGGTTYRGSMGVITMNSGTTVTPTKILDTIIPWVPRANSRYLMPINFGGTGANDIICNASSSATNGTAPYIRLAPYQLFAVNSFDLDMPANWHLRCYKMF